VVDLSLLALGAAELDEAVRLSARDPIDATAAAYRALRAFEAAPTRRGQAAAHLMIGELALFSGEPDEALEHLTAGSDLFGAVEDAIGRRAAALGRHQAALALGRLHTRLGDLSAAGIAFHEAADQAEAAEDDSARASAERELGSWARSEGRGGEAAAHYRRAFEALTRLGDLAGLAAVHLSLGNLCSAQGAWSDAVTCYAASAKLFRGVDDRLGEANAERFWGQAARGLGQPAQAQRHLARALELYQAVGDKLGQSYSRLALGELASQGAEAPAAREHLAEAVELLARLGESEPLAKAVELLADSFEAEGDRLGALRALTSGLAEARQAGRWETSGARRVRAAAARGALESRDLELAVELAEPLAAGEAIERGMAGLTGLLPALVTGPPSSDPKTERLRRQIQELAARLRAAANPAPDAAPRRGVKAPP
jgi:tetratricopeptide (TPR) repeat protein